MVEADFQCDCTGSGFQGTTCNQDIDECEADDICNGHGDCTNQIGSYSCDCDGKTNLICIFVGRWPDRSLQLSL